MHRATRAALRPVSGHRRGNFCRAFRPWLRVPGIQETAAAQPQLEFAPHASRIIFGPQESSPE
jgi:hypothetical protein